MLTPTLSLPVVNGTNEKLTSQIIKTKNQDRKLKKIKNQDCVAKAPAQANKKYQIPRYAPHYASWLHVRWSSGYFPHILSQVLRDATMEMSNLYTKQKGNSTSDILWYSVAQWIQHSSRRRLLWSDDYDVSNTAVKDAMWRIRFGEIMSSAHLADNMKITADLFFKVLFKHLNDINNTILIAEHVAVDEMIE